MNCIARKALVNILGAGFLLGAVAVGGTIGHYASPVAPAHADAPTHAAAQVCAVLCSGSGHSTGTAPVSTR